MRLLNDILYQAPQFDMWRQSILLCYRGSIAHGTFVPNSNPGSIDDKDVIGVAIPTGKYMFGLTSFEQFERQHEYWDVLIYDFRKFVRLLLKSNPNVMQVLWTDDDHYLKKTAAGKLLIENRSLFASKRVYKSFCGYAYSQLHRMENMAFNGYMGQKRKQLVEKFGFDCKNAQHLIRLLRQGIEFLNTGKLLVKRPDANELKQIKLGQWSLTKVKDVANGLFKKMEEAYRSSVLPEEPNHEEVDALVFKILTENYAVQRYQGEPC